MEYSRAVATGLNYLETQYGIEVNAVETKEGILFEGKSSKAPIVLFSRSKLNANDFIVSFREINEKSMIAEIKFENVARLNKRVIRTQEKLLNKYGLRTVLSKNQDRFGEEIIISDRRTALPVARIIITDPETIQYTEALYYPNNIRKAKIARAKRFVLQGLGAAVLAGALIVGGKHAYSETPKQAPDIATTLNTYSVDTANDLLLFNWSNYAMGEIADIVNDSEYLSEIEHDNLYGNYFVPIMSSYYNYQEQLESDLPKDFNMSSEYHGEFRRAAKEFNERLADSLYFGNLTFEQSPYAVGTVVDDKGLALANLSRTAEGYVLPNGELVGSALAGEVYDENGVLVNANEMGSYDVLIPAVKVKNNTYDINSLPDDAKTINGVTYVSDNHLEDFEKENGRTR